MCEIHFLMNTDKPVTHEDTMAVRKALDAAKRYNKDGWGFFTDKVNSVMHYMDTDITKRVKFGTGSEFVIAHNRFATAGKKNLANCQPIEMSEIVVTHNGTLHGVATVDYSDTIMMAYMIQESYRQLGEEVESIKETLSNLSGSLSMFVYFKSSGNLYYMKNASTKFKFGLIEEPGNYKIVGSTDLDHFAEDYVMLGFPYGKNLCAEFEPKALSIYQITREHGISEIGDFTMGYWNTHQKSSSNSGKSLYWSKEDKKLSKKERRRLKKQQAKAAQQITHSDEHPLSDEELAEIYADWAAEEQYHALQDAQSLR